MKNVMWAAGITALATVWIAGLAFAAPEESTNHSRQQPEGLARAPMNAQQVHLPPAVREAFEDAYPNAVIRNVSREKEGGELDYEITSTEGGISRDLVYRPNGSVVEMEESISQEALPQVVRQAISREYPKGEMLKAEQLTRGQTVLYEIRVRVGRKNHEATFTPDGVHVMASARQRPHQS